MLSNIINPTPKLPAIITSCPKHCVHRNLASALLHVSNTHTHTHPYPSGPILPPSDLLFFPDFHVPAAAAAAKSLQSCPTLCDPIDGSPPGSPVPGILQARTLEWLAISFSSAWKWKVKVKLLSRVWFLVTPWTVAYQAPPSMGFARQGYWSGVPSPSPSSPCTYHPSKAVKI